MNVWTFTDRWTDGLVSNLCWWQHPQWLRTRWGPSAGVLLTYMGCWTLLQWWGGEAPSARHSISLYQKHSTHSSSSSLSTPVCFNPFSNISIKLLETRRNLRFVHNNKMSDVLLSNGGRAHSLAMFSKMFKKPQKETSKWRQKDTLTGVGLKPSWMPGKRSGEERSTEMSLRTKKNAIYSC